MVATSLLVLFLVTAAATDIRSRKVFNWTTYPGILVAFTASALATWLGIDDVHGTPAQQSLWGLVSWSDSLTGFLACGAAMLVCYVFFPGGVGGGDVKLIAMIGAFLGLYAGLEVMLWTFVLGACQAVITLIWKHGAVQLLRRAALHAWVVVRAGGQVAAIRSDSQTPTVNIFLSPSALVAVCIVRFQLLDWL
jgi:prepilin peptidase CpaA